MRTADDRIIDIDEITDLIERGCYIEHCYQCGAPYTLNDDGDLQCTGCGYVHDIGDYVDSQYEAKFDC